jgi:hypothetical protein
MTVIGGPEMAKTAKKEQTQEEARRDATLESMGRDTVRLRLKDTPCGPLGRLLAAG